MNFCVLLRPTHPPVCVLCSGHLVLASLFLHHYFLLYTKEDIQDFPILPNFSGLEVDNFQFSCNKHIFTETDNVSKNIRKKRSILFNYYYFWYNICIRYCTVRSETSLMICELKYMSIIMDTKMILIQNPYFPHCCRRQSRNRK